MLSNFWTLFGHQDCRVSYFYSSRQIYDVIKGESFAQTSFFGGIDGYLQSFYMFGICYTFWNVS